MAVTTGKAVTAVIAVVLVAAVVYMSRSRPQQHSPAEHGTVTPASRDAGIVVGTGPAVVPRGDVTIDAQRQQLLGVRLSPVTREPMARSVRTTGIVKYDESRLTDINVKLEGWIRDLHADYTGQPSPMLASTPIESWMRRASDSGCGMCQPRMSRRSTNRGACLTAWRFAHQ
jgi:hypothetical protein